MPHPKHKTSKSRRDKRRTHKKTIAPSLSECGHCHHPKLPHRACPSCGYYGGRMVVVPNEA